MHTDEGIGDAIFGEETTVEVEVSTCTFGPHTRDFGIRYAMYARDRRAPMGGYIGTFFVGRGGNNSRARGVLKLKLPADFSTKPVFEQVMFFEKSARQAGIDLGYYGRPQVLQPSDLRAVFI